MSRRVNMRPRPSEKHMHIYQDFSRGLNTMDADEKIMDSEVVNLRNMDIGDRGSLVRRHGMVEHIEYVGNGYGQGFFTYFKEGGVREEIVAVSGKLYKDGVELPIQGLSGGFQTNRQIEAVQYRDKLYIATGTKLCQYDGEVAKVVDPFVPKPLDALYIGTNALADDPFNFMEDGESSHLRIDGVTFSTRYGLINEPVTVKVFISKPNDMGTLVYKFEQRTEVQREGFWETGQDWSTENEYTFTTTYEGNIQFRIWVKEEGASDYEAKQYLVPRYTIKPASDPKDDNIPHDTIHSCNRILLHWERLILYGDVNQPDAIFISHLRNMAYFPMPNNLLFESTEREEITSIVKFRDNLVVFTPNTIQALYGKGPHEYHRVTLNTSIGCIAPYSVTVTNNHITFLSYEGVYVLKSLGYTEDKANVDKIDTNIANLIEGMEGKEKACAVLHDRQYHIVFPDENKRFRFYLDTGSWTKDYSIKMNFSRMYRLRDQLYGQQEDGTVLRFDEGVYDDAGYVYEDRIETKYFDFGEPYHPKKLREIHMVMGNQNQRTKMSTYVYADAAEIVGTDTSYADVEDCRVVWVYQNDTNMEIPSGTSLGTWEMGVSPFGEVSSEIYKMRINGRGVRAKLILSHEDTTPIRFLGLGWIFKTKRP